MVWSERKKGIETFFENFSQLNAPTISEPDMVGALSQCNITKLFKKNLKYPQISQLLYQQAKRPRVQATKTIPYHCLNGRQPQWKTTSMEDNPNGKRTQWKTTSIEDDVNGRRTQWKMISMEDNLNGRRPQWKMTSMKYDLNKR